jgi:serine/threonine-protein kinase
VLRPHARGGLGEVFIAQDQELGREVALKEIRLGHADHPDSRARFVREAEVTGQLEHPGVVPVYSLGAYADGRPYYAMRFIRGDSLQQAIEAFHRADGPGRDPGERALSLRQLLGRFVDVCNAIAYAHSRGVLHRDLKPGNIMLGQYGETLVVDWGLAKARGETGEATGSAEGPLRPALGSDAAPTQTGKAFGTPQYMSPEQAVGRLDLLGPASDVYSLGATLYCLLTGKVPFEAPDVGALLQRVQKGEFPPPRQVKRNVPAALEAVCLKGMALRPEDRYASTRALADDIEHWLADEPVSAWREPVAVRAGRWVRRHRVLAASTAVALLVALLLGSGGAVWLEQRKEQERRERLAQQQRAREQAEAGLAQAVELRQGYRYADAKAMLEQVRGWVSQTGDTDLDARLDQAEADLVLARDLDRVRQQGATLVKGTWNPGRVREQYPVVLAGHGLDVLKGDLDEMGQTIRASTVRHNIVAALDDWALEETDQKRFQRLLGLANRADEPDPWRQAVRLAVAQRNQQRQRHLVRVIGEGKPTPDVVRLLARALGRKSEEATALLRRMQLERPRDFWVSFALGNRLDRQNKHQKAAECYLVAVVLRPNSGAAHYNLGHALHDNGQVDDAIACYRQAIALDPRSAPPHSALGTALQAKGKVDEAIVCYNKAIAIDPKFAKAHYNLGTALQKKGKVDEAIDCYHRAIALDPRYAHAHNALGAILYEVKRNYKEAIACFKRAIAINPRDARAHNNLGTALKATGNLGRAFTAYRKAVALAPRNAQLHLNLGWALDDSGLLDDAIASFNMVIELEPRNSSGHTYLGWALYRKGKTDEAIARCREAIALDSKNAWAHNGLGVALARKGKDDEDIDCYKRAIALYPRFTYGHINLASAWVRQGKWAEAARSYRNLLAIDPKNTLARAQLALLPRMAALEPKLAALLKGEYRRASNDERLALIALCTHKRLYRASAGLYAEAFAAAPRLGDDRREWHCYNAACAAALAGTRYGKDAAQLDDTARAELRYAALCWLQEDLGALASLLQGAGAQVRQNLLHWRKEDADLAAVRDPALLSKLPEAEQVAWLNLWAQVDALLTRTRPGK